VCGAIVVVTLLMVVAASAYLTQGQVRLTRIQQQLTSALGQHSDLEARVAQLADPSAVISQAQLHGLTAPTKETDLPQVTTPTTSTATSTGGR
jgi:cell division protein FtsL